MPFGILLSSVAIACTLADCIENIEYRICLEYAVDLVSHKT